MFRCIRSGVNGLIDELSIYRRALSAAELQAIVNAGSGGKCPTTNCIRIAGCSPTNHVFTAGGLSDNFIGREEVSVRPDVVAWMAAQGTGPGLVRARLAFDDPVSNGWFASSLDIPRCATAATLRLRVRANFDSGSEANDRISLGFAPATEGISGVWTGFIGNTRGTPALTDVAWLNGTVREVTLDLARLPLPGGGFEDLLPLIAANGFLNVLVFDDTSVDFAELTTTSCCCQPDLMVAAAPGEYSARVQYIPPPFTNTCGGPQHGRSGIPEVVKPDVVHS